MSLPNSSEVRQGRFVGYTHEYAEVWSCERKLYSIIPRWNGKASEYVEKYRGSREQLLAGWCPITGEQIILQAKNG